MDIQQLKNEIDTLSLNVINNQFNASFDNKIEDLNTFLIEQLNKNLGQIDLIYLFLIPNLLIAKEIITKYFL